MRGVAAVQALTGVTVGRARTATLARSAPAPSPPVSSRAAPRCTPIGPSQDRRGLSIFPPSSSPPQPETRTGSPSHRPTFRASPALPDTASPPFLPNRSFWAASGSRARPFGRRWKGTGRGGPGTPPERSREAGTRGRGGANLLGAALPWQRGGRAEGEGGSEKEGDVVLPRPPPQLPLPACCRFFPEAAAGSCREQLQSLPYCVFP